MISKSIVPLADLAPVAARGKKTKGVELLRYSLAARRGVQRLARRILIFAVAPTGKHNLGGWWPMFSEDASAKLPWP